MPHRPGEITGLRLRELSRLSAVAAGAFMAVPSRSASSGLTLHRRRDREDRVFEILNRLAEFVPGLLAFSRHPAAPQLLRYLIVGSLLLELAVFDQIGRASCRERG